MRLRAQILRSVSYAATLVVLGSGVAWTAPRLDARRDPPVEEEFVYLPEARFLRAVSLGYNNALADILWFRTISYFGGHYRKDRLYPWLAHMCELVTDIDPRAEHVYRFGGVVLPWEANQVDAGIKLLEKGTRAVPDSWLLPFWLGFNEYFFKHNHEKALAALEEAARHPDADPFVIRFASVLAAKQHGPELALQLLAQMEQETDRGEVRAIIREQMLKAQAAVDIARLNRAVDLYATRFGSPPASLTELVYAGTLREIPEDPFGGVYQLDSETGMIRSSTGQNPPAYFGQQGPGNTEHDDETSPSAHGELQ